MNIYHDELEDWARRTMQALQEVCDDAQEAAGNPDGEDQLSDVRGLMFEYERIVKGLPAWQAKVSTIPDDEPNLIETL